VDASAITGIDYSAGRTLKELQQDLKKNGVVLALTRVSADLKEELDQQELTEVIGANRILHPGKNPLKHFDWSLEREIRTRRQIDLRIPPLEGRACEYLVFFQLAVRQSTQRV
jgi:MFS superfamily sulfate permease-like transporter